MLGRRKDCNLNTSFKRSILFLLNLEFNKQNKLLFLVFQETSIWQAASVFSGGFPEGQQ